MKKWRIALVAFDEPGYTESFFIRQIEVFQALGAEVTLFIPDRKKPTTFTKCKVVKSLPTAHWSLADVVQIIAACLKLLLFYPNRLLHFYKEESEAGIRGRTFLKRLFTNIHLLLSNVDQVHFFYLFNGIGKESLGKVLGAKLSASVRGDDVLVYPQKHPGCYNLLAKKLDILHCISAHMLHEVQKLGFSDIPAVISGGSIGSEELDKCKPEPGNDKTFRILTVARLTRQKGIEDALLALALLKKQYPELKILYTVIGDGVLRTDLIKQIHNLGLPTEVDLCGKVPHQEVFEQMKHATVYLQPSRWEGLCNATMEAMYIGLPVVVSDIAPFTEYVDDGVNGFCLSRQIRRHWRIF